jgi:hypothetical protein
LSYGGVHCGHDEARHLRSLEDIKAWFSQQNTGTAETSVAAFWRTVEKAAPGIKTVVVRRPVEDVVNSLMNLGIAFARNVLTDEMRRMDRKLDQIVARVPGALEVQFDDLENEETCARVFEHCLDRPHDPAWWRHMAPQNLQCDMPALIRYMIAYRPARDRLIASVRQATLAAMPRRSFEEGGITFQQESCETWRRDGESLFQEHFTFLGEGPAAYEIRNWPLMQKMDEIGAMQIITGRCNGRMFGYCVSYIAPATDDATKMTSLHISIFCSDDFKGQGLKLQRASIEALKRKGVDETCFRSGVKGSGPRMASVYKRLGAENLGEMWRLPLK